MNEFLKAPTCHVGWLDSPYKHRHWCAQKQGKLWQEKNSSEMEISNYNTLRPWAIGESWGSDYASDIVLRHSTSDNGEAKTV